MSRSEPPDAEMRQLVARIIAVVRAPHPGRGAPRSAETPAGPG
jgi:hypothetical protein